MSTIDYRARDRAAAEKDLNSVIATISPSRPLFAVGDHFGIIALGTWEQCQRGALSATGRTLPTIYRSAAQITDKQRLCRHGLWTRRLA